MPTMPPMLHGRRTRAERGRSYDAERRKAKPWRAWYNTKTWRAIREQQLAIEPLCERCKRDGDTTEATVVNHRVPHRGDWDRFVAGPFESLCKPHHDGEAQREERGAAW